VEATSIDQRAPELHRELRGKIAVSPKAEPTANTVR
jgi:hypothetical protein